MYLKPLKKKQRKDIGRGLSCTAQKILLLLAGGVALGLSASPGRYSKIKKVLSKELASINQKQITRAVNRLYESKLISYDEKEDGSVELMLNDEGRTRALCYKIHEMQINKPKQWDQRWRVVLFDIPEKQKSLRDALRNKLKQLNLLEFQKSVFVHPYECRDEIDFVIELYDARRYVRFIEAVSIDNELHLKKRFNLLP